MSGSRIDPEDEQTPHHSFLVKHPRVCYRLMQLLGNLQLDHQPPFYSINSIHQHKQTSFTAPVLEQDAEILYPFSNVAVLKLVLPKLRNL